MTARVLAAAHHPDCYPSDPAEALAFFDRAWAAPAEETAPEPPPGATLAGIVTPHIDFRVHLAAYAAAFRPLLAEPPAELYLILGVGHRSPLEWSLDRRDGLTPLGRAECAREEIGFLEREAGFGPLFAAAAHAGEHSIEFPLLWLQALHHRIAPERPVRFLPLLCGGLHACVEGGPEEGAATLRRFHALAAALGRLFAQAGLGAGGLRVIVSIDGCHLGPRFGHPFKVGNALLRATAGWEELLWARAGAGDAGAFLDWFQVEGNDRYFDGVGALALLLAAGVGDFRIDRTAYAQWFTEGDASAVTFSSGRVWRVAEGAR